jgi:capsular polysaccharide biosynthesis protein
MSDPVTPHRPEESPPQEPSGNSDTPPDEGRRRFSDVVDFLIESARRTTVASAATRRARAIPSRSLPLELLLLGTVIVAVTTVGAYFVSAQGTKVYGARAEFLIHNDRFASDSAINRQIQTQSVLILSRAVLGQVATDLGMEINHLEKIATAEIIGESQVLRLLVADPDPNTASEIANAIAGEYLATASDLTRSLGDQRSQPEVDLVTEPYVLETPLQPDPMQGAAAGAMGGLVIAGGVVFVVTQRSKR